MNKQRVYPSMLHPSLLYALFLCIPVLCIPVLCISVSGCSVYNGVIDDVLRALGNEEICEPAPDDLCDDGIDCTVDLLCQDVDGDGARCRNVNTADLCNCDGDTAGNAAGNTSRMSEPSCRPHTYGADPQTGCICLDYAQLHDIRWQATGTFSFLPHDDGSANNQSKISTVSDNNTGLLWQAGTSSGVLTYPEAEAFCRALVLDDFDDWRLPSLIEMQSLFNYNRFAPASDFPQMPADVIFWTHQLPINTQLDTQLDTQPDILWIYTVESIDGTTHTIQEQTDQHQEKHTARCVRSPVYKEQDPNERYMPIVSVGDVLVVDIQTGLMWEQTFTGPERVGTAYDRCEDATIGGFDDWALPNIDELQTLVDWRGAQRTPEEIEQNIHPPLIDWVAFPNTPAMPFWSRDALARDRTRDVRPFWYVDFFDGSTRLLLNEEPLAYSRCVRRVDR